MPGSVKNHPKIFSFYLLFCIEILWHYNWTIQGGFKTMSPQRSQSMLLFSKGVCEFSSKQFRKILSTFLFHQTFPTFYSTQIIELHSCRRSQRLKYFECFLFHFCRNRLRRWWPGFCGGEARWCAADYTSGEPVFGPISRKIHMRIKKILKQQQMLFLPHKGCFKL